jgi:hypothetical protein
VIPIRREYHFLDMPDRLRARVLVTALLIMLTFAGSRALGSPGDWARPEPHVLIVGGGLECVLLALFVALRWRHHPPSGQLAGRLNRMVAAALVIAMIGVLVVTALSQIHPSRRPASVRLPHVRGKGRVKLPQSHEPNFSLWLGDIRDVLVALLILAILLIALAAWRRRRRARLHPVPQPAFDDVAEADLARAVQSGRMALAELDDARAAIIACYLAMERSLAELGAARAAAETPDELLVRAVDAKLVPPRPAGRLTALFYEARYSTHPMPMSQRDQAARALADLAAVLPVSELA